MGGDLSFFWPIPQGPLATSCLSSSVSLPSGAASGPVLRPRRHSGGGSWAASAESRWVQTPAPRWTAPQRLLMGVWQGGFIVPQ